MKFHVLSLLSLGLAAVSAQQFPKPGRMIAYNTDNLDKVTEANRIGCVSANGKLSASSCGIFGQSATAPNAMYSSNGNCSFQDKNEPLNTDSKFGGLDHSLHCYETTPTPEDVMYYLPHSSNQKWLCTGDLSCYFDAKKAPVGAEEVPLWVFRWGGDQMGITPGHVQVALKWEEI